MEISKAVSGERIQWIDIAKGICMIAVIMGHYDIGPLNKVVFSFHIAGFFMLSGYTMHKRVISTEWIRDRFKRLMMPYFLTCFCVSLMDIFNSCFLYGKSSLKDITEVIWYDLKRTYMASGANTAIGRVEFGGRIGAVWFFPAMFFAYIAAQFIINRIEQAGIRMAVSVSIAFAGMVSVNFIWLPFSIQSAMMGLPFIVFGYEMCRMQLPEQLRPFHYILLGIIYFTVLIYNKVDLWFVTGRADDYILAPAAGVSFCIILFGLSKLLSRCRFLAWIGKNTSLILGIHLFELETCRPYFMALLSRMGFAQNNWMLLLLSVISVIIIAELIIVLLRINDKQLQKKQSTEKKQMNSRARNQAADIFKGILIVLMLLGHMKLETISEGFRSFIYSFHMVGFIFISGYFYHYKRGTLRSTILRCCRTYLVPYTIFGIVYLFTPNDTLSNRVLDVLAGMSFSNSVFTRRGSVGPVYFILLLFMTRVTYTVIDEVINDLQVMHILVILISLTGVLLGNQGVWLPWSFDIALYCMIYYHLGRIASRYKWNEYIHEHPYWYFIMASVWAFMIHIGGMELALRKYYPFGAVIAGAVCGVLVMYLMSEYLFESRLVPVKMCAKVLEEFGKCTLYILLVHKLLSYRIDQLMNYYFAPDSMAAVLFSILIQCITAIVIQYAVDQAKLKVHGLG